MINLQQPKDQAQAPGCFGAASVYGTDSEICKACVAYESCGAAAYRTLEFIQSTINVRDILAKHAAARQIAVARSAETTPTARGKLFPHAPINTTQVSQPVLPLIVKRKTTVERVKYEISAEFAAIIEGINSVKAREVATALCESNKITECFADLPRSVNPFDTSGPHYVRITCDMLLHGGFTQAQLKKRLVTDRGMTEGGASSHSSLICAIFMAFGLMVGKDGRFTLNPALD